MEKKSEVKRTDMELFGDIIDNMIPDEATNEELVKAFTPDENDGYDLLKLWTEG